MDLTPASMPPVSTGALETSSRRTPRPSRAWSVYPRGVGCRERRYRDRLADHGDPGPLDLHPIWAKPRRVGPANGHAGSICDGGGHRVGRGADSRPCVAHVSGPTSRAHHARTGALWYQPRRWVAAVSPPLTGEPGWPNKPTLEVTVVQHWFENVITGFRVGRFSTYRENK